MEANIYEMTYKPLRDVLPMIEGLDKAVELLKSRGNTPTTPKEIGVAVFGDAYTDKNFQAQHYWGSGLYIPSARSHIAQIMRHLHKHGFVARAYIDGEPVEITEEVFVNKSSYDVPRVIKVHDDDGNTYEIENPKWDAREYFRCERDGDWETVTKTVTPKIKAWVWCGE